MDEAERKEKLIAEIIKLKAVEKELKARHYTKDLYEFNKVVLHAEEGSNMVPLAPFHKELCDFVTGGEKANKLLLVPRGHLKSTLVTIGYSLLRIAENPDVRILIANATYDMATSFLSQIKKHIQHNETFRELYGDMSTNAERWSENMISIPKFKPFTKKEATVTAYGMGGNLVSQHYDLIIADDLVNREYISTTEQIQKSILFYKDALDLLEPGTGKFIIIGTRWADSDLYGWIMDKTNPEQVYRQFDVMIKRAYEGNLETGEGLSLLYPEKYNKEILQTLKINKGPIEFSCTPAETPIVMSDWKEKRIDKIKPGDEVVGWIRGKGYVNGNVVKSVVKRVMTKNADIYQFRLASGNTVRCTLDHKWYTGRLDKTHKEYSVPKIGRKLQLMYPRLPELDLEKQLKWQYLAGLFDGEGSSKSGGCLTLTQGIDNNRIVRDKMLSTLKDLEIEFSEDIRVRDGRNVSHMWMKDNFNTHLKFLKYTDLAKKEQLIDNLFRRSCKFVKGEDKIVGIEYWRNDTVYALETETGNYIAWGYGSSNSQYLNEPLPQESAKFKVDWFKTVLEDELKVRELSMFTMVDPAIGQRKESDKTAIVTIAVDQWNNWFVVNIIWDHMLPNQIINHIFSNYEAYHPKKIGIEMVSYQKSLQYALIDEMRRRNFFLPIVELKADRAKSERIEGLIPRYANGTIYHLQQCSHREEMEDQLMRYPVAKHDDIIDALAYGLQIAHQSQKPRIGRHHDPEDQDQRHRYLY